MDACYEVLEDRRDQLDDCNRQLVERDAYCVCPWQAPRPGG